MRRLFVHVKLVKACLAVRDAGIARSRDQSKVSSKSRCIALVVPHFPVLLWLHPVIFEHARVLSYVVSFHLQPCLRLLRFEQEVVVTMWTVLVALLKLFHILPEGLLTLLASERHFERLFQIVILRVGVALRTVEPLSAAWRANGDLGV